MEAILRPDATFGIRRNQKATNLSQSMGSLTAGSIVTASDSQSRFDPPQGTGSPSVGTALVGIPSGGTASVGIALLNYSRGLMTAGGAQPIFDSWRSVYLIPPALESSLATQSETMSATEVLAEIFSLTGLGKAEIADELLDVSRMAINNWERGHILSTVNEAKIRGILDVLRRATKRNHDSTQMRGWLLTPTGSHAVRPIDLLKEGRIDEARMLAITTPNPQLAPIPGWVQRPVSEAWADGAEQRQEAYPEGDDLLIRLANYFAE